MLNFTYIIYYSIEKIILVDFSNFNKKKIKIELYVYDVLKIVRMIMINVFWSSQYSIDYMLKVGPNRQPPSQWDWATCQALWAS